MRAEIVSIGTELLLGTITDTNASYLAQRLAGLGIDCYNISQVGDNMVRLREVLERAWGRSDIIVTTGGLGPTVDDLTREAIAEMLGEQLFVSAALAEHLRQFFRRRGIDMPERNLKQAALIPSATSINNPVGTAPGWWVSRTSGKLKVESGKDALLSTFNLPRICGGRGPVIVSMPGVPFEMKRMWEQEVEPRLRTMSDKVIISRTLKVLGLGESAVEQAVVELMSGSNPTLAPYAKQDGVHLRITAKAGDEATARELIAPVEAQVRQRLGNAVYGTDDDSPAGVVLSLLMQGVTLAVLEIGPGAIGAVSSQLGADRAVRATFAARDLVHASQLLGAASPELEHLARSAMSLSGAGMALAIEAVTTRSEQDTGPVRVEASILVATAAESADLEPIAVTMHVRWTTMPSEVSRLVGLSALNQLRLALLRRYED